MPSLELFCERMRYWCEVADLGYDQTERWNIWDGGECDCSSLVIHALQEAGFDTGNASYTGDLSDNLTARGWVRLQPNIFDAQPGDILLSDVHHVAVVVSGYGWGAMVAEAWLDEKGGIYYGQSGDQTGLETRVRSIYVFSGGWDCFLRYEGEEDMTPEDLMYTKISTADSGNIDIWQTWSWGYTYSMRAATAIEALAAAVQTLAASKGADAAEIALSVKKAVDAKLKTLTAPEIDYEKLASAIAAKMPDGADAAAIAKATAAELSKRLKA